MKKITLGDRIKFIRQSLGKHQAEFGEMLEPHASKGVISHWEHGTNVPTKERLQQIAKIGGVSVEALLNGSPDYWQARAALDNKDVHSRSILNDYTFEQQVNLSFDQQVNLKEAETKLNRLVTNHHKRYRELSDDSKLALSSSIGLIHQFEKLEPHEHTYDDVSSSICLSILLDNLNAFAQNPTKQNKQDVKQSFNQLLDNLN